ncbi:hypothetical protein BUALT_Bualt14G0081600 [Buddleja alternifolia]|uniref:F-box protein n=1 Tax=Buddleja alternifolia TaxID=168488 RepID=A0AAV6WNT5_9LAMI|nr:hypothetical protein BUALT_Bualt14G0081600 [Buddleja alternifolia]
MERGKRSEAINSQIQLPEAIIQHIQSLLNGKEAAQTSVVSKSWYNAWLTTPNLDLDEQFFEKHRICYSAEVEAEAADRFASFVKKTMKRYRELNLNIAKLRLRMTIIGLSSVSLANESIMKALHMGVSDLNLELRYSCFHPYEWYTLPHEVLEAEALIRLSASHCKIDWPLDRKLLCSRLESLILRYVHVRDDVVWNIISSCPLIENLLLSECDYFVGTNGELETFTLRSPLIEFCKGNVGSVIDGPIKVSEFHKLKSLFLQQVNFDEQFFSDFSLKFPCLEDLNLHYCLGNKEVRRQISSHSLRWISVTETRMLWVNFDVPNICKFTFSGPIFSCLSFTSVLKEWESDISISCYDSHLTASWFDSLKRFLTKLIPSKISLILRFFKVQHIYRVGEIEAHNESVELLCKRLIRQVNRNCCILNQNVFGQCDLQEVNVEYFEEALTEWTGPLPSAGSPSLETALFSASTNPKYGQKVRLRLKWGPCDGTGAARVLCEINQKEAKESTTSKCSGMITGLKKNGDALGLRMEAIDEHLQLHEPIIHHIQSFLSGKEAAWMAVLCKSWYNSWLTRPTLDFDERDFRIGCLATELIVKVVRMSVNNLNFEIYPPRTTFILPKEVFEAESLKMLSVFGCKIDGISGENVMCSRLKSLSLYNVSVGDDMIRDIISRCPLIENLVLSDCYDCRRFNISSHSLKYITLAHEEELKVKFDVPNMLKLKFSGSKIPSFRFSTASRECESDISIACSSYLDVSWFCELNNFLLHFIVSKMSLHIELVKENQFDNFVLEFQDLPRPIVDILTLKVNDLSSVCSALLDGIFWSFRPKVIAQCLFPISQNNEHPEFRSGKAENELVELLCKKLMDLRNGNGLKEVNAVYLDDTVMEWRPLPWIKLLNGLLSPVKEVQIRFRLRWDLPDGA